MASNLIIGIGTTGLRIIEEAQQYHYEYTKTNKPGKNVEWFAIDTDDRTLPKNTPSGETSITQVGFPLSELNIVMDNLKKNKDIDSSWLPEQNYLAANETAAGGMPTFGRLALWKNNNYETLKSTILSKYAKINPDDSTNVYIVGSLTGGTGSGLCVDIAYLVRQLTGCESIFGLFLLPPKNMFGSDNILFENSYSALTSIQHYTDLNNTYKVVWPDNNSYKQSRPPYKLVRYLSSDFDGNHASMGSLSELIKVAGMQINLAVFNTNQTTQGTFESVLGVRRVDLQGNEIFKNFISTGFYMIQYPKAKVEELLAIDISQELLSRLTDNKYLIDSNKNKVEIQTRMISVEKHAKSYVEQVTQSLFDLAFSIDFDGTTLQEAIEKYIDQVVRKKHNKISDEKYLFDLFSRQSSTNIYAIIENNKSLFVDAFIRRFDSFITEIADEYNNLRVCEIALEKSTEHIQTTCKFWKDRYELEGDLTKWDRLVQKEISNGKNELSTYTSVGLKRAFLLNEVQTLTKKAVINLLIPVYTDLSRKMIKQSQAEKSSNGVLLPSIQLIKNKILNINKLTGAEGQGGESLEKRKNELVNSLTSQTSSFKMLYSHGTLQKEIQLIESQYKKDANKLELKELCQVSKVWEVINTESKQLFDIVLNTSIQEIQNRSYLRQFNLVDIIKGLDGDDLETASLLKLFNNDEATIRKKVPAMVQLNEKFKFKTHPRAKLVVMTSDHKKYKTLFENSGYELDAGQDNVVDFPDLSESIIFYQEYGLMDRTNKEFFEPSSQLQFADDTKRHILNELSKGDIYLQKKTPYMSKSDFKKYLS